MNTNTDLYLNWFRHAAPYINSHRGKTFVVMLPGDCVEHSNFAKIVTDLALLNTLGVRLVVVHGARTQIKAQLHEHTNKDQFHRGIRITSQDELPEIIKAVGATRINIESHFTAGLPDSPMYGAKVRVRGGNFVTAMPQGIVDGIDYQFTGRVRSIDSNSINTLISDNAIALISPIGYSLTGEVFNLSFADVATATAIAIGADKLITYNDDGAIVDEHGQALRELTLLKCEKFLVRQPSNNGNTYFSLRACHKACEGGVPRAHVISSTEDGALLKELYTRDGSGTMVYRDNYETIRGADIGDVVGMLNLIRPLEEQGVLVKRSRERLENEIAHFTVMEKDGLLIGCAGLYPIEGSTCGELACVVVSADYQKGGRAAKLLGHLERQASKLNVKRLFALTTQTAHWFLEQGFTEGTVNDLPEERQSMYNFQRASKVLVKDLHVKDNTTSIDRN